MIQQKPLWVDRAVADHILSIPPYVPGKPIAELERELGIKGAVKMASNENPLGPSPLAVKALENYLHRVHAYPESSAPNLREALANRFGVPAESVILGNGSDEIMQFAAHVFIQPGDEAIIGANTFSMYRISVRAFGGNVISVPLRDFRFDLPAMAAAVTERTRLVFIAIPNSPTGTIVARREFESFLRDLPREGLIVVVDEAYREYVQDRDCPLGVDYIGKEVPVLVLRTFSKIYGLAGLRVGYGFSEPWLIELINRVRAPFNVNAAAQEAALAALDDVAHVEDSVENTEKGKRFLTKELHARGIDVIPSQANFLTFCLNKDALRVYESLLREGVIVRPLHSFGMDRCIRVTIGKEAENRRFVDALTKVLPRSQ